MMFLGRFRLGEWVYIPMISRDSGTPYAPPHAPLCSIYNSSGTKVAAFLIPPVDKNTITGMFCGRVRLSATYSVDKYRFAINFTANSSTKLVVGHFEVVAGGHVDGAVISNYFYQRPHAAFLVQKLDSEQRLIIKNPRAE
jgi:hypothetical protein